MTRQRERRWRVRVDPVAERWLLSGPERGNPWTRLHGWTQGNVVVPLIDGRRYFERLARALAATRRGDVVLFSAWRGDADQVLLDGGPTIGDALAGAARRGVVVRGLMWRSHVEPLGFSGPQNRALVERVNAAGGEVVLDHRVRPFGSHHQKFVVVRFARPGVDDVAFVGGIDLARTRRDDGLHGGDPLVRREDLEPWHDAQLEVRGPAVADVELVFRERWEDPSALEEPPWVALSDEQEPQRDREPSTLPTMSAPPPPVGSCAVQVLCTYPRRVPPFPFARDGERSIAHAYAKALRRARALVYVEEQYLWSRDVAEVFASALRRNARLRMVIVVPRLVYETSPMRSIPALLGHGAALRALCRAAPDRVIVVDVENHDSAPVYVHAKVCVVDDVWACVGSGNLNHRSWTYDSELTAAFVDATRDPRTPMDAAGTGEGARIAARDLRLELAVEHLDRDPHDVADLIDPLRFFQAIRRSAHRLEQWHHDGEHGPRPPGRLRPHKAASLSPWQAAIAAPLYEAMIDPDGRSWRMRAARTF
ncbi:phospholipase [Hoyosella sp. G463]|uniref:Phospholipase n=1 Tax=Lolliginicoccus lacisalsi TaxID=2742202 RepID=A0A927JF48_9ACTN|nr:phospholipase D family protein [Lolliginicoccus lacisalsi]MBD8507582.1 phospholipase [Lolliginicoccus lacisalsi]